jgi:hypothetical protein
MDVLATEDRARVNETVMAVFFGAPRMRIVAVNGISGECDLEEETKQREMFL